MSYSRVVGTEREKPEEPPQSSKPQTTACENEPEEVDTTFEGVVKHLNNGYTKSSLDASTKVFSFSSHRPSYRQPMSDFFGVLDSLLASREMEEIEEKEKKKEEIKEIIYEKINKKDSEDGSEISFFDSSSSGNKNK
eukprot:Trichotokara_eunicae@DN3645_c0_g1_i2.p1